MADGLQGLFGVFKWSPHRFWYALTFTFHNWRRHFNGASVPGADREGVVGVWTSIPPSPRVRHAEGGNVGQGGSAQPHIPAILGLHVAARYAAARVLRVQPEVGVWGGVGCLSAG